MPDYVGSSQTNGLRGLMLNTGNIRYISVPSLSSFRGCDFWIRVGADKPFKWPDDGVFTCSYELGTDATIQRNENACPEGWTVMNV